MDGFYRFGNGALNAPYVLLDKLNVGFSTDDRRGLRLFYSPFKRNRNLSDCIGKGLSYTKDVGNFVELELKSGR